MPRLTLIFFALAAAGLLLAALAVPAPASGSPALGITLTPSSAAPTQVPPTNPPPTNPPPTDPPPANTEPPPAVPTNTAAAVLASPTATRTPRPATRTPVTNQVSAVTGVRYMAKFVCGAHAARSGADGPLAPGGYATAINLHNYTDHAVSVTLRPALDHSLGAAAPKPIAPSAYSIAPYSTLEVDCDALRRLAGASSTGPLRGMLDLGLGEQLPVAVVYTAATSPAAGGISLDVEYLEPFAAP